MGHPRYSTDDIVARGKEIYDNQLREKLEPEHRGEFLVIDIETGDYEIDKDDLKASLRAKRRRPDGARYGMRIGFPNSGTIGNAFASTLL